MAKEGTTAGDVYNEESINYLIQEIDRYRAKNNSKNVMKCLEQFLEDKIGDYLKIGKSDEQLKKLELIKESKDNKILIKSKLMS